MVIYSGSLDIDWLTTWSQKGKPCCPWWFKCELQSSQFWLGNTIRDDKANKLRKLVMTRAAAPVMSIDYWTALLLFAVSQAPHLFKASWLLHIMLIMTDNWRACHYVTHWNKLDLTCAGGPSGKPTQIQTYSTTHLCGPPYILPTEFEFLYLVR